MLTIVTQESEFYDSQTNRFVTIPSEQIKLEHSLASLYKWESKWCVPYLDKSQKTMEQELDYINCMAVEPIKDGRVLWTLGPENIELIKDYMGAPMTATTFSNKKGAASKSSEKITAEILYYRMFSHNIPLECETWHLNRLITLIRVFDVKSAPPTKMGKSQTAQRNAELNAARRAKYNSRG